MSTKLSSPRTELAVLRAACSSDLTISGAVLKSASVELFEGKESKELLNAILEYRRTTGTPPTYRMLLEDPNLSSDAVSFIRHSQALITKPAQVYKAMDSLREYRKRRNLYDIQDLVAREMNKGSVDSNQLIAKIRQQLEETSADSEEVNVTHFGLNDNADELIERVVTADRSGEIIPTGFDTFDSVNGGFLAGSLVIIAGTTGGGKSTLSNQLAVNMAQRGYWVDVVPLEMSEVEQTARIMATATRMDALKIILQRLTANEKRELKRRFAIWRKRVAAKGGRYSIHKPRTDIAIEPLFDSMYALGSKVKIIDYLGLLAGMDGDDQAKALGRAARYAKVYAENTGDLVILLAQLDEAGHVRYARAIAEHANNLWAFKVTPDTREQGILPITQVKARNQKPFPFALKVDSEFARVTDLPNNGVGYDPDSDDTNETLPNLADSAKDGQIVVNKKRK